MDKETYRVLASVRMERAIGLVDEAQKCKHTLRTLKLELICLRKTEQKMDSINNSHKAIIINEEICNGIFVQ